MSCPILSCRVVSCRVVSCCVVSCLVCVVPVYVSVTVPVSGPVTVHGSGSGSCLVLSSWLGLTWCGTLLFLADVMVRSFFMLLASCVGS